MRLRALTGGRTVGRSGRYSRMSFVRLLVLAFLGDFCKYL
jgi:hypothetical protein